MPFARMQRWPVRLFLLGFCLTGRPLFGQTPTPGGTWKGTWDSPNGSVYTAIVQLTVASDNSIDGSISWTLKDTRRADLQPKLVLSAIENVHDTYDTSCRALTFAGNKLDAPNSILGKNHQELNIARNGAAHRR